jgi:hypothetical protein
MWRSVFQNPPIANTGKPISKRAFRFREQVAQKWSQPWRQAFVEEEPYPLETLAPAANSAPYAQTAKKSSGSSWG